MHSVLSGTAIMIHKPIHSSTTLIHFVHYIHGRTAIIFCMLCPWLYEVLAELSHVVSAAPIFQGFFFYHSLWYDFKILVKSRGRGASSVNIGQK